MGVRLVRTIDWAARGSRAALALSVAALALGTARDFGYAIPLDLAIARTLSGVAPSDALERNARAALDAEDIALARGYADLAVELDRPLTLGTMARLVQAETPAAAASRNARGFAHGFATGQADGPAALAGSVAADLTVIGDVRDLIGEGGKMARGEEHSDLLLGLAAAGVAATAVTVASGGGAAPVKVGISLMKAARRAGTMTAEFAVHLSRVVAKAADVRRLGDEVGTVGLRGARMGERTVADAARVGRFEELGAAATDLRAASAAVGPAETVQLMRFVRSGEDLADLAPFAKRFGTRTRAVATLTGRASLRAFRTTVRLGEMLIAHLWAVLLWFAGLLAGALSNVGWRGARFVAARV